MRNTQIRKHLVVCGLSVIFSFLLIIAICGAKTLIPENGTIVKTNGLLTLDYSHTDQGYVMAKGTSTDKKLKIRVTKNDETISYDLNQEGEYEVFPLQYGSGRYTFALYKQQSGTQYSPEGQITFHVKLENENIPFLYPNQYVNFNAETPAVIKANELCENFEDPRDIYKTIKNYIVKTFTYDYLKSYTIPKKGVLPDINDAWTKRMGICQALSAIAVAMLRSQGVPAKLIIGTQKSERGGTLPHAWVSVIIGDKEYRFDPTAEILNTTGITYTPERYY